MIKIEVFKHYFTISSINFSKLIFDLHDFNKDLVTYKLVMIRGGRSRIPKATKKIDKVLYIIETKQEGSPLSRNLIRYPIAKKDDLLLYLKDRTDKKIEIIETEHTKGIDVEFNFNKDLTAKEHQVTYTNIIEKTEKEKILVDLQTGQGKTFIAMNVLVKFQKRFGIVVLPRYIDKWINDVLFLTDITRDEILVIQGTSSLVKAMHMEEDALTNFKCIIFSLTTISSFIKSYMTNTLEDKTLHPEHIFVNLGIDTVLNDESHQEFFSFYRLMLFSNNRLSVGLTATLVHNDPDIVKLYDIGFPEYTRVSNIIPYNKYINVISLRYRFRNHRLIRFKSNFGYNQPAFENSLIKNSNILFNYMNMINDVLKTTYLKRKKVGQKILIFMGTVKMCSLGESYFSKKYPELKVSMYTEKEDYSILENTDIICSTIPSAGTALDIANLITVIQTVNIDSVGANTQTLGRLREIKGTPVIFTYLWSSDIKPHKKYNRNRIKLFNKLAKNVQMRDYPKFI